MQALIYRIMVFLLDIISIIFLQKKKKHSVHTNWCIIFHQIQLFSKIIIHRCKIFFYFYKLFRDL
jgi:hypothetical protein